MRHLLKLFLYALDHKYTLWVLVGAGLALRLALLVPISRFPLVSDAFHYRSTALQLLKGENFLPYWPPGLPYYLAGVYRVFSAGEAVGRASMLLFYLAASVLLYQVAKKTVGSRAGNLTILVFAFYPTYVHLSLETLTQLPAAALNLAMAYLVISTTRQVSLWKTALLGVVVGAAILVRPSSALLAAALPLFLFWKTKKLLPSLLPLIFCAPLVLGWLVKTHRMTGDRVWINYANNLNFFLGNNPYTPLYKTWWFGSHGAGEPDVPEAYVKLAETIKKKPPSVQDRLYRQTALNHIQSRPDLFVLRSFNRFRNYFAFDTFTGSYLIKDYQANKILGLAILGLDALFYCALIFLAGTFLIHSGAAFLKREPVIILLGLAVGYALPYWLSFSHPAYHFPVVPLLGILASAMVVQFMERPAETWREIFFSNPKKKRVLLFFLLFFAYIQLEWVWVMWDRL